VVGGTTIVAKGKQAILETYCIAPLRKILITVILLGAQII